MNGIMNLVTGWWSGISVREQRLVVVCGALLLFGSIYWGVIQPLSERAENAQLNAQREKQLLSWVTDKADQIVELRGGSSNGPSGGPLNQVVSSSTQNYGIELIRMQPRDEMLQVWIKPVAFTRFVQWLAYLKEKQGVDVEFMDISGTDQKGVVEIKRLQLKRGV
ncbi:general secretion pathway protein GspM [Vibrio albus]|uniref:Type II secretion system protein M n=1 Tax=Vibrio albus TaxID=2200953 RepID=A0A2U3B843_9VIBR|nr:type II secretion system protein M [Vibrio albus]PWI32969.1 general secretion pathway protein GspM [Vibrio albus]